MKNVLWNIFEIAINFYQGAAAVWFIYNFLIPKSVKTAKISGAVFAFTEGVFTTVLNSIYVLKESQA